MSPNIPKINIPWLTDAYKLCHWSLFPPNTKKIYSYFESRGSDLPWSELKYFGLQMILKTYMAGQVFNQDDIEEARENTKELFGFDYFNYKGWCDILQKYEGRLPLSIKAVPEGKLMPYHTALTTVVNTDDSIPFLTNTFETLLVQQW